MQLTSICHGEATAHVHHVHLRHELGDVVVMREGEAEHLIFVRAGGEEPACQTDSQHHTEQCWKPWATVTTAIVWLQQKVTVRLVL